MSTPPGSRRRHPYLWLVGLGGATYIGSVFIIVAVVATIPAISWARSFKIIGLVLNLAGAIVSLTPRVTRDRPQSGEWVRLDTLTARYGLLVFAMGFIQQLTGNLIG
jgi:hypothetical protein